jgi:hypothetical protein
MKKKCTLFDVECGGERCPYNPDKVAELCDYYKEEKEEVNPDEVYHDGWID